jgi:hypothetical protein
VIRRAAGPSYAGPVTQWGLEAIFNPGKRFDDDERRRLEATREEAGDSSGGQRIDLISGRVVIPRSGGQPADADAGVDDAQPGGSPAAGQPSADRPNAAAARAAVRRARARERPAG